MIVSINHILFYWTMTMFMLTVVIVNTMANEKHKIHVVKLPGFLALTGSKPVTEKPRVWVNLWSNVCSMSQKLYKTLRVNTHTTQYKQQRWLVYQENDLNVDFSDQCYMSYMLVQWRPYVFTNLQNPKTYYFFGILSLQLISLAVNF